MPKRTDINEYLYQLAKQIAQDIFTDGRGVRAQRLVIEETGRTIGGAGWCEAAIKDRIYQALKRKAKAGRLAVRKRTTA